MSDKKSIQYTYDLSNDFYALFLDKSMSYTCAIFDSPSTQLEKAQTNKVEAIATKLGLKTNEKFRVLDLGCGWGNALFYLAKKYPQHRFDGVTLSDEQYAHCREQIKKLKIKNVKIILDHWKNLNQYGSYNRVFAIGIVEHVTPKGQVKFFNKINKLLNENGIFLLHGLMDCRKKTKPPVKNTFLQKQIFPNGGVDSIDKTLARLIQCNYEIIDIQTLRLDYYLTEKSWLERLQKNKEQSIRLVGEDNYRKFLIYLAGCTASFLSGNASIAQILCAKDHITQKDYFKLKSYQTAWLRK